MWKAGTVQQTAVGLARHDAHGPPRQNARRRAVLHPAAPTPSGQSTHPSRAAITPRAVAAAPLSQPNLLDRLDAASHSRHYSRQPEKTLCHWVRRLDFYGEDLTEFLPVQVGLRKGDEGGNPHHGPKQSRAAQTSIRCPRNFGRRD